MSLLLVIWGTIKREFGGVAETVDVCGEVASVKFGNDWPSPEYAGTWTLKVFGVGDLLNKDLLLENKKEAFLFIEYYFIFEHC